MKDKKMKYDLSNFMLDGGKKGYSRDKSLLKKKYEKKTARSFGEPPDNKHPNGSEEFEQFEKNEQLEGETLEEYKARRSINEWPSFLQNTEGGPRFGGGSNRKNTNLKVKNQLDQLNKSKNNKSKELLNIFSIYN